MNGRSLLRGAVLPAVILFAGCAGTKPVPTPPPPTPPAAAPAPGQAAPTPAPAGVPPSAAGQPPASPAPNPAPPAPAPAPPGQKQVTITLVPDPQNPGRMIPVAPSTSTPAATPAAVPAPPAKVTLATADEKVLGIPLYPGATREGGVESGTGEARYDKHIVLYTTDSPQKVEAFYRRQFPGASVIGSGRVGDQSFTNMRLEGSGKSEKRAFFFIPSGTTKTKVELTLGTGK